MKALMKDVSIDELKQLREEGYSNREIADCLDVSEPTIYRYLGRNPKAIISRVRSEARRKIHGEPLEGPKPVRLKAPAHEQPEQPQNAVLSVKGRKIDLEGMICRYTVFAGKEPCMVMISRGDDRSITLKIDDLQDFDFDMYLDSIIGELRHAN